MPIDARIPLGVQPVQVPSPLELYSTVQQIQGQREAVELRRLAAEEARQRRVEAQQERTRAAEVEAALQDAITLDPQTQQPTVDWAKLTGGRLPAATLFKVKEEVDQAATRAETLRSARMTADQKIPLYLGTVIAPPIRAGNYDKALWDAGVLTAQRAGALTPAQAEHYLAFTDPAQIKAAVDGAIAAGGGDKLEKVETVDAQGRKVTKFVEPTAGAEFPTAPPVTAAPHVGSFEDYVLRRFGPTPTAEQITQARKDYQQADDRPTVTVNTPRPITQTAEAGLITRLNTQWTTASKPARELAQQVSTMRSGLAAAERGDMAQGTEAVLQPFLKILDPNSVVREGEFFRLREGQSYIARAQGIMQRLTQGGFVPLAELKKYAALAEEIATRQDAYVKGVRERIGKVADRYNIPNELVFETEAPGAEVVGAGPKEGDVKPIPGHPGTEQTYTGGKWIRTK